MELYHVSGMVYRPGEVVRSGNTNSFYDKVVNSPLGWIETELEAGRPTDAPARRITKFAFASAANCAQFLDATRKWGIADPLNGREAIFYEVTMPTPRGCSLAVLERLGRMKDRRAKEMVVEYWSPTESWRFLEYLDTQMTIVAQVGTRDLLTEVSRAFECYRVDAQRAGQRWS